MENKPCLVIVNRKYLVKVESSSSISAEHIFLDNEYLRSDIKTCLAFDPKTELNIYSWAFTECETMSLDDLIIKGKNVLATRLENHNCFLEEIDIMKQLIKELEERLLAVKSDLVQSENECREYEHKYDLEKYYIAPEKIAALRNN